MKNCSTRVKSEKKKLKSQDLKLLIFKFTFFSKKLILSDTVSLFRCIDNAMLKSRSTDNTPDSQVPKMPEIKSSNSDHSSGTLK